MFESGRTWFPLVPTYSSAILKINKHDRQHRRQFSITRIQLTCRDCSSFKGHFYQKHIYLPAIQRGGETYVYTCVYVYIHICIYTCKHISLSLYIYIYVYIYMYTYRYISLSLSIYIYIYIYIYTHTCVYLGARRRIRIRPSSDDDLRSQLFITVLRTCFMQCQRSLTFIGCRYSGLLFSRTITCRYYFSGGDLPRRPYLSENRRQRVPPPAKKGQLLRSLVPSHTPISSLSLPSMLSSPSLMAAF